MPGYDPDVQKNRAQARQIMQKLGYGPDKRLQDQGDRRATVPLYRDPAVILIDQLKQVYIDGELELIDTAAMVPKIMRKDFTVGLNLQTSGPRSRPDPRNVYGCGAEPQLDGYCNPEVDKLIDAAIAARPTTTRRKQLVWEIERKLAEDVRPADHLLRRAPRTCWQPYVKGLTMMVNSIFNGWRLEDVWLDK